MSQNEFENQHEPDVVQPDEAEKLIKLWAQRQAEAGQKTANPNVDDFAEALGTTPETVRGLLGEVRTERTPEPQVVGTERKARYILVALLPLLALFFLLPFFMARSSPSVAPVAEVGPNVAATSDMPAIAEATAPVADAVYVPASSRLPAGLTIEVDGIKISGDDDSAFTWGQDRWETNVTQSLIAKIDKYFPPSTETFQEIEQIRVLSSEAIRHSTGQTVLTRWIAIKCQLGGETFTASAPILLNEDGVIGPLVREEQTRRLRKFANQLFFARSRTNVSR